MSAIFGLFNLHGEPVDADEFARMSEALSDLGPDGEDAWVDGMIGLGHHRLCFTPEDRLDQQPQFSMDRRLTLICDARLHNRAELASMLHLTQTDCAMLPDSALILRAWEQWDSACLQRLIGEFAIVLWDARRQRLVAARSPLGERPLFYHLDRRSLAFATMPRGLHALSTLARRLDEETVARFLATSWQGVASTFYRDIQRLPPGHQLVADAQGVRVEPYWQMKAADALLFRSDEETVDAFTDLFERVLADHLRSMTPVAVAMSGGLDSSSVGAVAAAHLQQSGKRLAIFTEVPQSGFDGPLPGGRYADETPFVQAFVRCYPNADLNLVQTDEHSPLQDLDAYLAAAEMPTIPMSNRVWWEEILRRARQQGIRVILTGDQGNLTISWNGGGLLSSLIRRGQWGQALREARAAARKGTARSTWATLFANGILPLLPSSLSAAVAQAYGWLQPRESAGQIPLLNPEFAAQIGFGPAAGKRTIDFHSRGHLRDLRLSLLTKLDVAGIIATGYQARYGVETRSPLMDVRLVDFCLNLPEEQFSANGETRRLIRRAMTNRLPPEILSNTRRGLQAANWFDRVIKHGDAMMAELNRLEECDAARRILNLPPMRQAITDLLAGHTLPPDTLHQMRGLFDRGIVMGRFLCSFEREPTSSA